MTIEALYQIYLKHPQICTDTRKILHDSLFFALKGESFNGNTFAAQALNAGVAYVIVDDPAYIINDKCILVEDVLTTLQDLARHHRAQLKIPFVGITGTNGKTTTKELLNSVLSQKFNTYATVGNLNNHIGVPLTLLSISNQIELAIIEMGANHQKEIAHLCSIAQPTHGLITNVGKAHLEGFGGFEGVKKGKGELYDYLKSTVGIAFVNAENSFLVEMSQSRELNHIIWYGNSASSLIKASIIDNNPFLTLQWEYKGRKSITKTNLTGAYNLENILAAITIGIHFELTEEEINTGIELYVPGNNRSQITKTVSNTLICDYYNANPSSMAVALENFSQLKADRKIIILGDMFELGDQSTEEHIAVINKAEASQADERIYIGKEFFKNRSGAGKFFETTSDAIAELREKAYQNSTILLKGSRGMKLEQLIEWL